MNAKIFNALRLLPLVLTLQVVVTNSTFATGYDAFLSEVEAEFDATAPEMRRGILTKPFLLHKGEIIAVDGARSYQAVYECNQDRSRTHGPSYARVTNALALAISLGRDELVMKFLPIARDLNSQDLWVWGFRQYYTPLHLALDPIYPEDESVALATRFRIIRALTEHGANLDFDFDGVRKNSGGYTNPALSAGTPRGGCAKFDVENEAAPWVFRGYRERNIAPYLQAYTLLVGADPENRGSSFSAFNFKGYRYERAMRIALDMYLTGEEDFKPLNKTCLMMAWRLNELLTNPSEEWSADKLLGMGSFFAPEYKQLSVKARLALQNVRWEARVVMEQKVSELVELFQRAEAAKVYDEHECLGDITPIEDDHIDG